MFYKHWKKISLALTAFFWASCNNTTVVEPLYGCPSEGCGNQPISSSEASPESSSSEATVQSSSSSETVSSSGTAESSSSFVLPAPAYGVEAIPCYEDSKGVKTNGEISQKKFYCVDGVTCKETEVLVETGREPCRTFDDGDLKGAVACPDYGIVHITERTYDCDGVTYNEAEFRSRYFNAGIKPPSSSSTEQSSSSAVTCGPNLDKFFSISKADHYSIDNAAPDASSQAKFDANRKITAIRDSLSKDTPKCLKDMQEDLERNFVAVYGAPYANRLPAEETCSDGTTRPTKEYLEQQKFDEEQAKKKPQYDEKYNEVYKEETKKLDKAINDCLNSNNPSSSSSKENPKSSNSADVTCAPGDSTVTYYPPSYSADIAKMNAEERAKRASVSKIDSTIKTLPSVPQCLANLRQELDMFVALYGAPVTFPKDEVCSDGTVRPTKEYLEYQKMKEEWEKNKPALDEECQKIYEEKMENIQKRINKCLNSFGTDQT